MIVKLTTSQKIRKVKLALKIIHYSFDKGVSISIASKKYKKNRRFVYDVNRRWIKKNSIGIPTDLISQFKRIFKPKKK